MTQEENTASRRSGAIYLSIGIVGLILALGAAYSLYLLNMSMAISQNVTYLQRLKRGDFLAVSSGDARACARLVSYQQTGDSLVINLRNTRGDSVSLERGGSLDLSSCRADEIADYKAAEASDAENARTAKALSRYKSFFASLKKGDLFTATSYRLGPAYCERFVGISSADDDEIVIATLQYGGTLSTGFVTGLEYSYVRGCTPGSQKLF